MLHSSIKIYLRKWQERKLVSCDQHMTLEYFIMSVIWKLWYNMLFIKLILWVLRLWYYTFLSCLYGVNGVWMSGLCKNDKKKKEWKKNRKEKHTIKIARKENLCKNSKKRQNCVENKKKVLILHKLFILHLLLFIYKYFYLW